MIDLIKEHLAALANGNWDDYKAGLAPDVVYEEFATMQRREGPDEYVKAVQVWKRAFPDLKGNVQSIQASEDRVFVELEWQGTHGGPFEGPLGTIQPTNQRGSVKAALIFTVKNGKITSSHHYFDLTTILRQLGIAPTLGAPAPSAQPTVQPTRH